MVASNLCQHVARTMRTGCMLVSFPASFLTQGNAAVFVRLLAEAFGQLVQVHLKEEVPLLGAVC